MQWPIVCALVFVCFSRYLECAVNAVMYCLSEYFVKIAHITEISQMQCESKINNTHSHTGHVCLFIRAFSIFIWIPTVTRTLRKEKAPCNLESPLAGSTIVIHCEPFVFLTVLIEYSCLREKELSLFLHFCIVSGLLYMTWGFSPYRTTERMMVPVFFCWCVFNSIF